MKEIWPIDKDGINNLYPQYSKYITEDQFNELIDRLNNEILNRESADTHLQDDINTIISTIANEVVTTLLTATNANISSAQITDLVATTAQITTSDLNTANIDYANITNAAISTLLTAQAANIDTANITSLQSSSITTPQLSATNINADDITITGSLTVPTLNVDVYQADEIDTPLADIDTATIDDLSVGTLSGNEAAFNKLSDTDLVNTPLDTNAIAHTVNKMEVDKTSQNDYYIQIPQFDNGEYKLIATDADNNNVYAFIVHKNTVHPWFEWSYPNRADQQETIPFIITRNDETTYVKINTDGKVHYLYYQSDGWRVPVSVAPTILDSFVFNPDTDLKYETIENSGIFFTGRVSLEHDLSPIAPLTLRSSYNYTDAESTSTTFDGTIPTSRTEYRPNQSVNTTDDVEHKSINTDHIKEISDSTVSPTFEDGTSIVLVNDTDEDVTGMYKVTQSTTGGITETQIDEIKGFKQNDVDYTLATNRPLLVNSDGQIISSDNTTVDDLTDLGLDASSYVLTDENKKLRTIERAGMSGHVLDDQFERVVDAETLADWNGKSKYVDPDTHIATYRNQLQKLGDVDEGNFDMPSTSHIDMNHSLYVGPELTNLSSIADGALIVEW